MPLPMWTCRGDWLVCQTTSVSNNPITAQILIRAYLAYIHVCSNVTRTAILNWGPFGRWTPGRVCLPAQPASCTFSSTLCGRSHGDQPKTASPHAVNPLMTNADDESPNPIFLGHIVNTRRALGQLFRRL